MQSLSVLARKTKTFFTIGNKKKLEFIEAYLNTAIARAYILFVPFNKLKRKMGKSKTESPKTVDIEIYRIAKNVSWSIKQAAIYTPWESKCLVQALTAQKMLKKRGVATTLYLGVKKDTDGKMIAHAWLRCGEYFVTGGSNRFGYGVVAKFSNESLF